MTNRAYMPQAKSVEWGTPQALFDELHLEFDFTIDLAATIKNTKLPRYYTKEDNAFTQDWGTSERCFCNPPYGKGLDRWVKRFAEAECLVVALLPARTDTRWFHDYILGQAEVRFLRGRLKFEGGEHSATFPSMVVIFKRRSND